ncbi:MAG: FmdB family transcriptional regulator [Armatimonadota bacterium]|nr:MAG: FmdB family transcriptional regulator [Armatimonadota bacterium]
MPVYEYACVECGHHFEQYHKVTDRPPRRCPKCPGRVRKVFRPVGIIFKGSGFHTTDYRKPEKKAVGEPKKQPTGTTSTKSEGPD